MEILRLPVVIVEDPQKTIKYRCAECPFSTTKIFQLKKHKVDSAHSARGLTDTVKTATIEVDQATGATLDGTLFFTDNSEVNSGDKGDKEATQNDGFNNEEDKFEQINNIYHNKHFNRTLAFNQKADIHHKIWYLLFTIDTSDGSGFLESTREMG